MNNVLDKLNKIIKLIKDDLKPKKIILFGSRAKGEEHKGSDIDLCVIGAEDFGKSKVRKLKEKIDEVSGLYSVDLIFYEKIDDEFKNLIIKNGKVIYEKK